MGSRHCAWNQFTGRSSLPRYGRFSVHVGTDSSMLRDYSGVIRRNATRYLVPGEILLQVVGKVEGPQEYDRQLLRRCLASSRLAADNVSSANRSKTDHGQQV